MTARTSVTVSAGAARSRGRCTALQGTATALVALATIVVLHAAGQAELAAPPLTSPGDLGSWLSTRGAVVAGFALVRLLALVGAWYLLATTALHGVAHATGSVRLRHAVELVTVPAARRMVARAAGASLAGASLAGVALPAPTVATAAVRDGDTADGGGASVSSVGEPRAPGAPSGERMTLLDDGSLGGGGVEDVAGPEAGSLEGDDAGTVEDDDAGTATMRWLPPAERTAEPPDEPSAESGFTRSGTGSGAAASSWTLAPGEHLWHVAKIHLSESWGRPVLDGEITRYWVEVVEANRASLPDPANPDLVYPGDVVELPPVPPVPR